MRHPAIRDRPPDFERHAAHPETIAESAPLPPDPPAAYAPDASSRPHKAARAPRASSAARPENAPAARQAAPILRQTGSSSPPRHSFPRKDAPDVPPQSPRTRTACRAAPATAYPPADSVSASTSAPAAPSAQAHPKQPLQPALSRYRAPGSGVHFQSPVRRLLVLHQRRTEPAYVLIPFDDESSLIPHKRYNRRKGIRTLHICV